MEGDVKPKLKKMVTRDLNETGEIVMPGQNNSIGDIGEPNMAK